MIPHPPVEDFVQRSLNYFTALGLINQSLFSYIIYKRQSEGSAKILDDFGKENIASQTRHKPSRLNWL